jgi:hypothetical protein
MYLEGVFMDRDIKTDIVIKKLEIDIETLRNVLNEICVNVKSEEDLKERLIVSQRLDRLIVKYINIMDK